MSIWYILHPFGTFFSHLVHFLVIWYIFCGHLVYFVAIWYILWPFDIFFLFWYVAARKIWQPWPVATFAICNTKTFILRRAEVFLDYTTHRSSARKYQHSNWYKIHCRDESFCQGVNVMITIFANSRRKKGIFLKNQFYVFVICM
jgi:hypothetical protein